MAERPLARFCAVLLTLFAAAAFLSAQAIPLAPERGAPVTINGPWEFFWMARASDIGTTTVPSKLVRLPQYWTDFGYPSDGWGTYRLQVDLTKVAQPVAIRIGSVLTAYRVLVDGIAIGGKGTIGGSAEASRPASGNGMYVFMPRRDGPTTIVVEVENFNYRKGGILEAPVLMDPAEAQEQVTNLQARELILVGGLLIMALYHIGLWILRPRDRTGLWFSLFCLAVMFRFMVTGEYVMYSLFPDFSWELGKKLEFYVFNLGLVPFMLFLSAMFPSVRVKRVEAVLVASAVVFGLLVTVLPARLNNHLVLYMEIYLAFPFVYYLSLLIRGVRAHLPGAGLFLAGLGILLVGALNDVLTANQVYVAGYIIPQTFFAVIVLQSFIISRNFSSSFAKTERLSADLQAMNSSLRRFIPQEFFGLLGKRDITEIDLGDRVQKEMSIMFTDLRGFTALSEKMSPSETFGFLNSFFGRMGAVIREHGGFIDKYLGDGFLALFPDSPDAALSAAAAIQSEIVIYNEMRARAGYPPIELGIGIHHGLLTLGTVGESGRMDTTVIADSVNLASRLEGMSKQYGKGIIVTVGFLDLLAEPERWHWRYLGKVRVQGRSEAIEAVHVYDGLPEAEFSAFEAGKADFEQGISLYRAGEIDEAARLFAHAVAANPADRGSQRYLARITFLKENGLPDDWDAVEQTAK